jgi:hypothetical protein
METDMGYKAGDAIGTLFKVIMTNLSRDTGGQSYIIHFAFGNREKN